MWNEIWINYVLPIVTGGSFATISGILITMILRRANVKNAAKDAAEQTVEGVVERGVKVDIKEMVMAELKPVLKHFEELKTEMKDGQTSIVDIVALLGEYFSQSKLVNETTKDALKQAVAKARKENRVPDKSAKIKIGSQFTAAKREKFSDEPVR